VLVTACSPEDPKDKAYYAKHGYEGGVYNLAADLRVFPRGTQIRVPGYMETSYPGKFWEVDSAGGSVIRRSTRKGVVQIDRKFRTLHSAREWGSKWLNVEVIDP
jgi:3D (Asp-Asp-Asp) domain-containing protein